MTSLPLPLSSSFFHIFVLQFHLPSSSLLNKLPLPASIFIRNNWFCHSTATFEASCSDCFPLYFQLSLLYNFSNQPLFYNGTNIYAADHIPAIPFLPASEHLNISFSSIINSLARHAHPSICSSFSLFIFLLEIVYSIFLFKQKHLGAGSKYLRLWCINFQIHFLASFVENHSGFQASNLASSAYRNIHSHVPQTDIPVPQTESRFFSSGRH